MIDWNKSAKLNSTTVEELKSWFDRYPQSARRIIAICDIGGEEREVYFHQYRSLCHKCAHNTSEFLEAKSRQVIQYHIDNPEAGKNQSERMVQYYIDNPAAREASRLKTIEQFSTQEARNAQRKIITNSDAHKATSDATRGGNDIVMHHWLYDDADLSKYTMPMTRSEHGKMHRRMQLDGYKVPHINSDTDDNGLWGYT